MAPASACREIHFATGFQAKRNGQDNRCLPATLPSRGEEEIPRNRYSCIAAYRKKLPLKVIVIWLPNTQASFTEATSAAALAVR